MASLHFEIRDVRVKSMESMLPEKKALGGRFRESLMSSTRTLSWMRDRIVSLHLDEREDVGAKPLSQVSAVVLLCQTIMGAGVVAIPGAMNSAGLAGGLGVLFLCYLISMLGFVLLVLLANHTGECSYAGFARKLLGGKWDVYLDVIVLMYTLGVCIGYVVLFGNFLSYLVFAFSSIEQIHQSIVHKVCMTVATLLIGMPLSCLQTLGALKVVSLLGLVGVVFSLVAVMKRYADGDLMEHGRTMELFKGSTFAESFPILALACGGHFNCPALYKEVAPAVGEPDWGATPEGHRAFRRMANVIFSASTIALMTYATIGLFAYATWHDRTQGDFTRNCDASDTWMTGVRIMMSVVVLVAYPLVMSAARRTIFQLVLSPMGVEMSQVVCVCIGVSLSVLCLGVALALPEGTAFETSMVYNGAINCTQICYIFPAVFYLRLPRAKTSPLVRVACWLLIALGIFFGIASIVVTARRG
uniref:Amino acid transporter transmembrane domain-containing protein n=1 Tax=Zooxanthella nutricula TaxID=1333877 RepID=A0A7S2LUV6_9DINO